MSTAKPPRTHREADRQAVADYEPDIGTAFLHTAIDDHSRVAYVEVCADEKSQPPNLNATTTWDLTDLRPQPLTGSQQADFAADVQVGAGAGDTAVGDDVGGVDERRVRAEQEQYYCRQLFGTRASSERCDGDVGLAEAAVEYFEENGITVLGVQSVASPAHVENARSTVQDAITSYGDELDGVWGGWDEVALGAVQALEAAGIEDVPVTGIGGQDFAVAEIEKGGSLIGTIPYDVAGTDAKLLEILDAWINDGELPADPAIVIPPGAPITQK